MIKKILILLTLIITTSCVGFSIKAGVKFHKTVDAHTLHGNPGYIADNVRLQNLDVIYFPRVLGECGGGVTLSCILVPVIPVWIYLNKCHERFYINIPGSLVTNIRIKYNGIIYDPITVESHINFAHSGIVHAVLKKYKFKIENFWKFRMADDKTMIVNGKDGSGKEFEEHIPIKWGIMLYYNWNFP